MKTLLAAAAMLLTAPIASAATYTVTTIADSGHGSLRQAITEANSGDCAAPCRIDFALGSGYSVITPQTALPIITASDVSIRGTLINGFSPSVILDGKDAGFVSGLKAVNASRLELFGLAVMNFQGHGIFIDGGAEVVVQDCAIGTDHRTRAAAPNGLDGIAGRNVDVIRLQSNFVDSSGGNGIYLSHCRKAEVVVNEIGNGWWVSGPRPNNGFGVYMDECTGAIRNNGIAHNKLSGVAIYGEHSRVEIDPFNRIAGNGGLGIDLGNDGPTANDSGDEDAGPNELLNTPVIVRAVKSLSVAQVDVAVNGRPFQSVGVFLFTSAQRTGSNAGQGNGLLAFRYATTDGEGNLSFRFMLNHPPESITATVTAAVDVKGEQPVTSEFAPATAFADAGITYAVRSTADSGPGSLRQAILDANEARQIAALPAVVRFALPPSDATDPSFTIVPRTPLPPITNPNLLIDGTTSGAGSRIVLNGSECGVACNGLEIAAPADQPGIIVLANLVIGGFGGNGISVRSARDPQAPHTFVHISGCLIGTDASGERPMGNGDNGVDARNVDLELGPRFSFINQGYLSAPSRPNVIGANGGDGVHLQSCNAYWGANFIGVGADGRTPLGNGGHGVRTIGGGIVHISGGEIAFNRKNGIDQTEGSVALRQTAIHDNGELGIDLGLPGPTTNDIPDADGLPNYPVITSAAYDASSGETTITGTAIAGHSGTDRIVSIYASAYADPSGHGEGARYVSGVNLRDSKLAEWSVKVKEDLSGQLLSATAVLFDWWQETEISATSEFSPAVPVTTSRCTQQAPALLTAPNRDGVVEANKPATFSWTSTSADQYIVWIRPIQQRAVAQPTTGDRSITIALPAGEYEWFVESKFNGCDSTHSIAQKFIVQ